jgi:cytochrome c
VENSQPKVDIVTQLPNNKLQWPFDPPAPLQGVGGVRERRQMKLSSALFINLRLYPPPRGGRGVELMRFGFTLLMCSYFGIAFPQQKSLENNPPSVTIVSPSANSRLQWNSIIPYSIRVSDKEDGDSEYNEISNNEVLLFIRYLPDSTQVKKYLLDRSKRDHQPLQWMSTSTCFTCHAARTKLIGPSYDLVAQRYRGQPSAVDSLAKRIINGSTGIWGDLKMPPHPDLKVEQVKEIVRWILKNNDDPDQNYIAGIEGAFRTKEKTKDTKGVYVLTASYTDHGSKVGQQSVVLKMSE